MGIVEENVKKILNDIKNSRFSFEIPKKELILMISAYTQNPYPYINRLWIDGYIKLVSQENTIGNGIFKILTLDFKDKTLDNHKIEEGYENG
jgi:hypothetical protein